MPDPSKHSRGLRPAHLLLFLPFLLWLAPLGWMAAFTSALTDDAFISFRYARNLLEGHGLVFNPGERVEGYTNFLWVLELAALWGAFGWRPEESAPWLSAAFTGATLAAMLWWAARLPSLRRRGLVAWMAAGLVCCSATFASWSVGGGLETRQFTFFVVLAVACLSARPDSRRALLLASLSLAAASLTRPEGPLIAACCFGWFAAQRRLDSGRWLPPLRDAACLAGPCVAAVALHYLFRYGYYGEWLPNTYHAKHVRPWYEAGSRYLLLAALDAGLYLLLPLAMLSLAKGWRAAKDLSRGLPLLCVLAHMAYVARIGGDYFGYRLLDFYWPLLAVPAAEGLARLGAWAARTLSRPRSARRALSPWGRAASSRAPPADAPATAPGFAGVCALALFLPVLFYSSAMQFVVLREDAARTPQAGTSWVGAIRTTVTLLDDRNAGWLLAAPGMPALTAAANELRSVLWMQKIGRPWSSRLRPGVATWGAYRNMERGIIPADALMSRRGTFGYVSYNLADVRMVDHVGLTDATIARAPVSLPNSRRVMAHDRRPPDGHFTKRGVNFSVYRPAASPEEALRLAAYAAEVGPSLWMPFNAPNFAWVERHFKEFHYDIEANRRFKEALRDAEFLFGGPFDLWLVGKRLLVARDRCSLGIDSDDRIALHVFPENPGDLPVERRDAGFLAFNFRFGWPGVSFDDKCWNQVRLPDFPLSRVRAGQHRPGEPAPVWQVAFAADRKTLAARLDAALDAVAERTPEASGPFDVHLPGRRLTYVKAPCTAADMAKRFFLHVFPTHEGDLPTGRAEFGFEALGFEFLERGALRSGRCVATAPLPDYAVAKFRTGQWIRGRGQIWQVEVPADDASE